jgi:hypothetical protein
MYTINVSFKDILRIGTADSLFTVIWTGLVHDYVHVFLQVFVHSPLSFTSAYFVSFTGPWTSLLHRFPAPLSFPGHWTYVVRRSSFRSRVHAPASLTSPVPSSTVVPRSLNLRRSPVLLSFTGPRTCLAHQSGSQFVCRSRVYAPVSFTVPRFVSPSSVLRFSFPFAHGSMDLSRSSFPTSPVVHQFPVGTRCVCIHGCCTDLVNQLQYTAISDVISLLLPPTWVALLYVRAAWLDYCAVPGDLVVSWWRK